MDDEIELMKNYIKENYIEKIVVDSYQVTPAYFKALRETGVKIFYIDDINKFHYDVDGLLNYSPSSANCGYEKEYEKELSEDRIRILLGTDYVPLREQFLGKKGGKMAILEKVMTQMLSGEVDFDSVDEIDGLLESGASVEDIDRFLENKKAAAAKVMESLGNLGKEAARNGNASQNLDNDGKLDENSDGIEAAGNNDASNDKVKVSASENDKPSNNDGKVDNSESNDDKIKEAADNIAGYTNVIRKNISGLNIFITSGGSDPLNISEKIIKKICADEAISRSMGDGQFHLLAGRSYMVSEDMRKLINSGKVVIHQNVSNVAEIMRICQMAVTPAGTTLYELCACGVPAVSYTFTDNQFADAHFFADKGLISYAGDFRTEEDAALSKIVESLGALCWFGESMRKDIGAQQKALIDGKGAERIAFEIVNL